MFYQDDDDRELGPLSYYRPQCECGYRVKESGLYEFGIEYLCSVCKHKHWCLDRGGKWAAEDRRDALRMRKKGLDPCRFTSATTPTV